MNEKALRCLRGFKDILPEESVKWHHVESVLRDCFRRYRFKEIRVPLLEQKKLFARGIGDATDIVQKEMYTFTDRHGDDIALRPEGTASVVRSYIEQKLFYPPSIQKLFYFGPMFRYERPQKGRFRQFHQAGAEVFGSGSPVVDAEVIHLLYTALTELGIEKLNVKINSVGCGTCRPRYITALTAFLEKHLQQFCPQCTERKETNPLRVLDCKNPQCREALQGCDVITDYLCEGCAPHYARLKELLTEASVPFIEESTLVRGLDYYTKTAFEVSSSALGSQDAVAGGGRYDKLVEELGGPPTEAVGFAIGLERLLLLLPGGDYEKRPDLLLIPLGEKAEECGFSLASSLRKRKLSVQVSLGKSLKAAMKSANAEKFRYVVVIGDNEMEEKSVSLKHLDSGETTECPLDAGALLTAIQNAVP